MSKLCTRFVPKRAYQIYNEFVKLERQYREDRENEECIGYPIYTPSHYQELEMNINKLKSAYNMLSRYL